MKTPMRKLIARSRHVYATRRLIAGDEYEATEMHARLLVGARRAIYAPDKPPPEKPKPAPAPADAEDEEVSRLRGKAQRLGIEAKREIAQAKSK